MTAKYTYLNCLGNSKYIGLGSKQETTDDEIVFSTLVDICQFCINGKSIGEINEFLLKNSIDSRYLDLAIEKGFILDEIVNLDDRYSRNHIYYQLCGYNYTKLY